MLFNIFNIILYLNKAFNLYIVILLKIYNGPFVIKYY